METTWGQLAWAHAWQLTALATVVGPAAVWLGRRRPHLAHLLWLLVIVKSLTPPVWSSPQGVFCWLTPERSTSGDRRERVESEGRSAGAGMLLGANDASGGEATNLASGVPRLPVPLPAAGGATGLPPLGRRPLPGEAPWVTGDVHGSSAGATLGWKTTIEKTLFGVRGWFGRGWAWVWGSGSLLFAVAAWWKLRSYRRQWRDVDRRASAAVQAVVDRLARRLDVRRPVRAIVTRSNLGPAVVGVVRPLLVLPRALFAHAPAADGAQEEVASGEEFAASGVNDSGALRDDAWLAARAEALEPILAHELLHVRRGDLWVGWLLVAARIVWWFHPLVAWASRLTAREAERCCDEEVIGALGCAPSAYARSLVEVLECKRWLRTVAPFPGVRPVEITSRRLERIMSLGQGCRKRTAWWMWGVFVCAAALTLPGAARVAAGPRAKAVRGRESAGKEDATKAAASASASRTKVVCKYQAADLLKRFADEFQVEPDVAASGLIELARSALRTVSDDPPRPDGQGGDSFRAEWSGTALRVVASPAAHDRLDRQLAHWREVGWPQLVTETRLLSGPSELVDHWNLAWQVTPLNFVRDGGPGQGKTLPVGPSDMAELDASELRTQRRDVGRQAGATETISRAMPLRIAVQSAATVDQLLSKAQNDRRINVMSSPKVSTFSGQQASISSQTARALQGVRAAADGSMVTEPNIVPEGWRLDLLAKVRSDARIDVAASAIFSQIRRVDRFAFSVGLKQEHDRPNEAAAKTYTVEVPEVSAQRIHFDVPLAADECLIVRGLPDVQNQVQQELVLLIRCRRVTDVLAAVAAPPAHEAPKDLPAANRGSAGRRETSEARTWQAGRGVNSDADVVGVVELQEDRVANDKPRLTLRRYAVADLVVPPAKSVRVDLATGRDSATLQDEPAGAKLAERTDGIKWKELIRLIVSTVHPDSWQAAGGAGQIDSDPKSFSLIVKQTDQVHRAVTDLLEQLRRLDDIGVSIRVRTVTASPQRLAELGLTQKGAQGRPEQEQGQDASRGLTSEVLQKLDAELKRNQDGSLHAWEWPRVTALNGQKVEYSLSAADEPQPAGEEQDDEATMELLPMVSADRSHIRLSVAFAAITQDGAIVGSYLQDVADGRWFVLPTRRIGAKDRRPGKARETVFLIQPLVVRSAEPSAGSAQDGGSREAKKD